MKHIQERSYNCTKQSISKDQEARNIGKRAGDKIIIFTEPAYAMIRLKPGNDWIHIFFRVLTYPSYSLFTAPASH